jgi:DNA-binding response OmpR family regulator
MASMFATPTPERTAAMELPVLLADSDPLAVSLAAGLRDRFRVSLAATTSDAVQQIERRRPALVVVDLALPNGGGLKVCESAKRLAAPATVLATSVEPRLVPDALGAGCDGVLIKPYAPNLFYTRVARMVRARADVMRERARHRVANSRPLLARSENRRNGTNQEWPNTQCPHCDHQGVTSFEFVSYRRAWFACLACKKVWIARRLEDL